MDETAKMKPPVEAGRQAGPGYDYLLVDVDGTLLDSSGRMSERTGRALHRAAAAGMQLVLATGRTCSSLSRITSGLGLPPFHLVASGGALALDRGGNLRHAEYMPDGLWREVSRALADEGLSVVVFSHRPPEPLLSCVQSVAGDPHFEAYLARNPPSALLERRVLPDLPGAELSHVVEVAALGRGPDFDQASRRLLARFGGRTSCHNMQLFINGEYGRITEFFAPGVSKWKSFLALCPGAAARPERVIAVGDEANDLEMVRGAGLGIAMGNAIGLLKEAADMVTADHDSDGVALALERVLDGGSFPA
ncbi:MAG: HAD family hydrolase [Deltaproteobacteria bacterium]|nr:HAD family hydrolase [Deltaproteobacteria bacterium]